MNTVNALIVLLLMKAMAQSDIIHRHGESGNILDLLIELKDQLPLRLQLLYDAQYEELVSNITHFSMNISSGLMLYHNDGQKSTLNEMLTSAATGTTILLLFCAVSNILNTFRMIRRERLESHKAKWLLVFSDEDALAEVVLGLEGVVHEGTQVTLVRIELSNTTYYFSSSRIDDEGVVRFFEGEKWHKNEGKMKATNRLYNLLDLMYPDPHYLYTDMRGRELRISSNDIEGFFGLDWHSGSHTAPKVLGIDGAIINTFSRALNFTYQIVRPPDGLWGNPLPNGTVTGLIGMSARREVAFAISAISVTWKREQVVDYTYPYFIEPSALLSPAPKEKNRVLASLSPFSFEVWLALMAAISAVGPLLLFESVVSESLLEVKSSIGLQEFSFNMFRTLTTQGNRIKTQHWPQRLLFVSWYFFCLIVSALYSGMLTAVLAIPSFETPIDYLTDLPRAVKNGYSIGILKDTAQEQLFKEGKTGVFRQTWLLFNHKNPSKSFVPRHDVGVQKVLEEKFVFIGFKISSELMVFELGRHKFHFGRENLLPMGIAMVCPTGVPYRKILDLMISRITERGLLSKWRADEFTRVSLTAASKDRGKHKTYAISLTHLQAAFYAVGLGISMATIVLVGENIIFVSSHRKIPFLKKHGL